MKIKNTLSAAVLAAALATGAMAQSFPGGTLTFVVPYGPGGGFDTAVRALAPYMEAALGNNTTIVVQNVAGAGGQRGAAQVARSEPDGRTIGIFNLPGFVLPAMLGERMEYDLTELSWVGRLENQDYVLLSRGTSDIRSIDDLLKMNDIVITSHGFGSTGLASNQIMFAVMGLESRDPIYVGGYSGTTEAMVGAVRGDGDITVTVISSAMSYVNSGDLRPLAVSGNTRIWDDVPTFAEVGFSELTPINLQRAIAGPPNIPADRLQILRDAFVKATQDPAFLETAARANMQISVLNGDDAAAEVDTSFNLYNQYRNSLQNPN